jgi:hypothetical protein
MRLLRLGHFIGCRWSSYSTETALSWEWYQYSTETALSWGWYQYSTETALSCWEWPSILRVELGVASMLCVELRVVFNTLR